MNVSAAPPALLFDLGARGQIVLTGKDRATFLQGLLTNDVVRLAEGAGCAAAFLTAKGKLLAECVVLKEPDRLVLDTPPELAATVEGLLRKYLVFNDVTIGNDTSATSVFHLADEAAGNDRREAEELLRRARRPGDEPSVPGTPHAHVSAQLTFEASPPVLIVRENRTGIPGFDVRLPSSHSKEFLAALQAAGARLETEASFEALRIAAGIPRWGAELTDAVLPDEARLRERGFISETKGCYVGQEIVARIKTYGHVNRLLVRLAVSGGVPERGDRVFFEGEDCGSVTSVTASHSPAAGAEAIALAYVKRDRAVPGTALAVAPFKENPRSLPAVVAPAPLA